MCGAGNYLCHDLKIITGAGRHSAGNAPALLPRVKAFLDRELSPPLPYSHPRMIEVDASREPRCVERENRGCLVVRVEVWGRARRIFEYPVHAYTNPCIYARLIRAVLLCVPRRTYSSG